MNRTRAAILSAAFILGCSPGGNKSLNMPDSVSTKPQAEARNASEADAFDSVLNSALTESDWAEVEVQGELAARTVEYQAGNLVPCPIELAEWMLEIEAMHEGKCLYRRRQALRRYDGRPPEPAGESGMSEEFLVCAMLVDGFASGSYQYLELADDHVLVKIDWRVSQGESVQTFTAELTTHCDQQGATAAGDGALLKWSFKPVPKSREKVSE